MLTARTSPISGSEIGLEHFGLATIGADLGPDRASTLGIAAIVDDYGVAGSGELFSYGGTDPVAGASDERNGRGR